jgi:hypothetical protein
LYGGWQRERLGFMFGLSGLRFALAVAAVLLAVAPISVQSVGVGLFAWPLAATLATAVWLRVLGRTSTEWAGLTVRHTINKTRGRSLFISGPAAPRSAADPTAPAPMDLPGALAPLRFLEAETLGQLGALAPNGQIAVVHHPQDRTFTAVARIRYPGIALADSDRRDSRVAGWGGLLAQLCNEASPFTRVAVVQRTLPDDGTALRRWTATAIKSDAPALAVETIHELLGQSVVTGAAHEAWLVFTLDVARARAAIRAAGGGELGALAVLVRQLAAASSAVAAAQLQIVEWLGVRDLAEVVRTAFDPFAVAPLAARRLLPRSREVLAPGVDPRLAGPAYAETNLGCYRHDGACSVTYQITEWPRIGVPAWFLGPVLTAQRIARRGFALHLEPIPARQAEKLIMGARMKRSVAVRMRQRSGQLVPEHERLALAQADTQDRQRAEGHGLVRFVGYLTVTVTNPADLDLVCSQLETDAHQAGLEVRRMWGLQDVGFFAAATPLGFGLPKRRTIS